MYVFYLIKGLVPSFTFMNPDFIYFLQSSEPCWKFITCFPFNQRVQGAVLHRQKSYLGSVVSRRGANLGCHFVSPGMTLWVCSSLQNNWPLSTFASLPHHDGAATLIVADTFKSSIRYFLIPRPPPINASYLVSSFIERLNTCIYLNHYRFMLYLMNLIFCYN